MQVMVSHQITLSTHVAPCHLQGISHINVAIAIGI
jgi:hypothetical protein